MNEMLDVIYGDETLKQLWDNVRPVMARNGPSLDVCNALLVFCDCLDETTAKFADATAYIRDCARNHQDQEEIIDIEAIPTDLQLPLTFRTLRKINIPKPAIYVTYSHGLPYRLVVEQDENIENLSPDFWGLYRRLPFNEIRFSSSALTFTRSHAHRPFAENVGPVDCLYFKWPKSSTFIWRNASESESESESDVTGEAVHYVYTEHPFELRPFVEYCRNNLVEKDANSLFQLSIFTVERICVDVLLSAMLSRVFNTLVNFDTWSIFDEWFDATLGLYATNAYFSLRRLASRYIRQSTVMRESLNRLQTNLYRKNNNHNTATP